MILGQEDPITVIVIVRRIENPINSNLGLFTNSARREIQIPVSTILDDLRKRLKILPYRISFLQQSLSSDRSQRIQWAQHCRSDIESTLNIYPVLYPRMNASFKLIEL